MTEPPLVLDSDFISSFGWVNRTDLLVKFFSKQMVVHDEVLVELSPVGHIKRNVDLCIEYGHISRISMLASSPEALTLARLLDEGKYGRGEAACMAYLEHNQGTMGSNNLSDVRNFCITNNKLIITTADVLCHCYKTGVMTKDDTDFLWGEIVKHQIMPVKSFHEYLLKQE